MGVWIIIDQIFSDLKNFYVQLYLVAGILIVLGSFGRFCVLLKQPEKPDSKNES
ncbi:hypothetical protein OENI_20226 [Oenococcus oeni]|nr:hypothetical protein OENI_20226 [Oenococcus oeni]